MSRRKLPPKQPLYKRAELIPNGEPENAWKMRAWVLPGHYDRNARRWQSWEKEGCMIITRSEYAKLLRGMRAAVKAGTYTYRSEANAFVNSLLFVLYKAFEEEKNPLKRKRRGRADRKAVAA